MIRFVNMLTASDGTRPEVLASLVEEEAGRVAARLGARGQVRCAFLIPPHPSLPDGDYGVLPGGGVGAGWSNIDAVLEVLLPDQSDLEVAIAAFDGLSSRLGHRIDPSRSASVVGTEHTIVEGMGAVEIHAFLRRIPPLSTDDFRAYWRTDFGPAASKTPHMSGYRQVHADAAATTKACIATGLELNDFDGVAVEWFASAELLGEASAWAANQASQHAAAQMFTVARMLVSNNPET
jgi:hypothetical protein